MNNQDQVPTIAELWSQFEQMSITGNPCYIHSREGEQWEAMFQSLRQQLLERCKTECEIEISPVLEYIVRVPACGLSPSACRDHAAAINFLAWEIEQREKEASGD